MNTNYTPPEPDDSTPKPDEPPAPVEFEAVDDLPRPCGIPRWVYLSGRGDR